MDTLVQRCAGLDIGKADLKACIRVPGRGGRRHREVRTFSTMTAGLLDCRQWLLDNHISLVGMEATADYWKPVYYVLESRRMQVKNVRRGCLLPICSPRCSRRAACQRHTGSATASATMLLAAMEAACSRARPLRWP